MALTARPTSGLTTGLTTVVLSLLTTLAALAGVVALSAPAQAESGYKFWGYYHLTGGKWVASTKGAGGYQPADGSVEGFRYATTTQSDFDRPPRAMPSFADICAGTQAAKGKKRVALVLDYGTTQDAPEGDTPPQAEAECAVVPAGASTQQALESVKPLRIEKGLICAIDGYPSAGCAEQVKNVTVPATEKPVHLAMPGQSSESADADSQNSAVLPLVGVGALVVLLGGGAVMVSRRRR
jgi:hypothetical protein